MRICPHSDHTPDHSLNLLNISSPDHHQPSFPEFFHTSSSSSSSSHITNHYSSCDTTNIPIYDTPTSEEIIISVDPPLKPPRKSKLMNTTNKDTDALCTKTENVNIQQHEEEGRFVIYIKVNSEDSDFDLQSPNMFTESSVDSDISQSISLSSFSNSSLSSIPTTTFI